MAGRDSGWVHKHVLDPRARRYLPEARKLLAQVREQMAYRGLRQYSMTQVLGDGTILEASVVGGIPRIAITPAPLAPSPERPEVPDVFVAWARDDAHTAGIDPDHPQQMLAPTWTTRYFNSLVDGFDGFDHNKKGTYEFHGGVHLFPHGIRHAGNVDWVGARRERVSWYGPTSRYFFDPYVQPESQYGKFVFYLGQTLLDVEDYITRSGGESFDEKHVLGAAIHNTSLLVVMAKLPRGDTPGDDVPPHSIVVMDPYPQGSVPVTFCRFAIAFSAEQSPAERVSVAARSREVLWSGAIAQALQPAFFNPKGTEAIMCGLPESVTAGFDDSDPDFDDNDGLIVPPSTSAQIHHFIYSPDDGSVNHLSTAISAAPPGSGTRATVLCDYSKTGEPLQATVKRKEIDETKDAWGKS